MTQSNYIKEIVRFGLENDQEKLKSALNELIDYSKKTKKINFALQLQSLLKDAIRVDKGNNLSLVGSDAYYTRVEDRELYDFILEKLTSSYSFENLICEEDLKEELKYIVKEHQSRDIISRFDLPIVNKILFYGPSGCGKTLASYVLAGELKKMMYVVNLGAIVSSKLGETSKNLAKLFRKAATDDCIIFIDEFDSLGKVRDYSQDHGEMKRIVNTILQLFDYLPQSSIVIAATNQIQMIDKALLRRFDINLKFQLPQEKQIWELVTLIVKNGNFSFDKPKSLPSIIKASKDLSYFSIQKTLITAIKRSLFEEVEKKGDNIDEIKINTTIWKELIKSEKDSFRGS
jgi:AAA+ superfamily predicted ATPase